MSRSKWDYRDVSVLLQAIRNFLLGRKHTLHPRFPWKVAARSIPPPDIPRGPEYKYSNQYYHQRNPFESVKPPVVAPVGLGGSKQGKMKAESVPISGLPTPGATWWWDGHSYYECTPPPPPPDTRPPCPPATTGPAPPPCCIQPVACEPPPEPPCPLSPDKLPKH
ncbi:basic proline-rich protein-like [Ostrinia furnacalis]|uniref:basic proline-rich protein-like n=1 Tax=Ostrinia furnacalis TaxID=93504 RepID=UPI00103BAD9B|nr:basic proline-rich protein-like [Ostrinia furnacalis]